MSTLPQLEANRVKYLLAVVRSHNIVGSAMLLPIRPKKEFWYRPHTCIHAELVHYENTKTASGHILFDQMSNSGQAIRRYGNTTCNITIDRALC